MADVATRDPLDDIFPVPEDRRAWRRVGSRISADTRETVYAYEHTGIGRALHLDSRGRVYGHDPEGVVRLFGRGGALALAVALNALFDGHDEHRPSRVTLPPPTSARSPLRQ